MIDLMEIGRRLWEDSESVPTEEPPAQSQAGKDLREFESQPREKAAGISSLSKSATIRNSSAAHESRDHALSAIPQNPQSTLPAPAHEIESIITTLTQGSGRDLGLPLTNRLRDVMAPMSRADRAGLVAAIDDAFAAAKRLEEARQRVAELLSVSTPRQSKRDQLAGIPSWTDWIAEHCALVPEDRAFVTARLHTLPPNARERAARRYVATWQAAAEAEPTPHRKENAGRRAANRGLLALVRC